LKEKAAMKITVFGKGNVGGGLADLWEAAGHTLTRLGRNGGDVGDADAVLIAVPGKAIAEAIGKLSGTKGKTVIDATNRFGVEPPAGFKSNAEFVKSMTNGPTAKAFNINFASLYGRLKAAHSRPSNIWCGDDSARAVVEQLSRDAGYDPVSAGPITNASEQENLIKIIFAINQSGFGPFVYRIAHPEDL
jgi:8-hydroxy-5-deazaflavin:NADPH oxidoreductase